MIKRSNIRLSLYIFLIMVTSIWIVHFSRSYRYPASPKETAVRSINAYIPADSDQANRQRLDYDAPGNAVVIPTRGPGDATKGAQQRGTNTAGPPGTTLPGDKIAIHGFRDLTDYYSEWVESRGKQSNVASTTTLLANMKHDGLNPIQVSKDIISRKYKEEFKVPNIVHYIHFGKPLQFEFRHYLNFLGVHKFMKPDFIFVHGDVNFTGEWWEKCKEKVANIYTVHHDSITHIHGRKLKYLQHASDFLRLKMLYNYGGLYLDNDVLVARTFDPLRRRYELTLDREGARLLANGIIVATPHSQFLRIWLEGYRDYKPNSWLANSLTFAHNLSVLVPHLIHVESRTLVYPNYTRMDLLYRKSGYDWSRNYSIHLYRHEQIKFASRPGEELANQKGAAGEIMRHIYEA